MIVRRGFGLALLVWLLATPTLGQAASFPRLLARLAASGDTVPRNDESLRRAAEQHARAIARDRHAAGWGALRAALRSQGLADAQIVPFVAVGPDAETLQQEAKRFVADRIAGRGFTQLGVAESSATEPGQTALVALFVRRLVELPPLATRLDQPSRLRGISLVPVHSIEAYMTTPSGEVHKHAVTRSGAAFAVPLDFEDGPGPYRFELLAHTERGPEVAALWTFAHRVPKVVSSGLEPASIGRNRADLRAAIDRLRRDFERAALAPEPRLERAAQAHAERVCQSLVAAHLSPDGRGPKDRARDAGFEGAVLENIAIAASISEAHDNLSDSPSHRYNLLDPSADRLGLGLARRKLPSGPVVCVVELFGVK